MLLNMRHANLMRLKKQYIKKYRGSNDDRIRKLMTAVCACVCVLAALY